ncbi:aldehyde dehydrogenase family protein [Corynebacterium hylobatis]|uniref:Aldehyde dehydrogenase family protein n=1 Tax=Corynebacterium hylobatis TaxID=1859290 RepID=A0A3R9ZCW7_9CORY|nr:aldehyde dehydrogenase family protein [Corynebacterium hylobatis]RSZ61397.1 aldehyde dehydrogenase family protein [Corynebacterium hylobatis]
MTTTTLTRYSDFYVDGRWEPASGQEWDDVRSPVTEQVLHTVRRSSSADVDRAVAAAKNAFPAFSRTTVAERIELLERILEVYRNRKEEFAQALTLEIGAPITLARGAQAGTGEGHLASAIEALRNQQLEESRGDSLIIREPAGVAALITPWNWPMNQIFTKVASALGAGCTVVFKPSEVAPLTGLLVAEILDEVGLPAGVFNLVTGDGPSVGSLLTSHPDVNVVSFTGSTRAGREITRAAADTIKIVHLELGGKSPDIILDDADFAKAVDACIEACFRNAGQSCSVTTRMLVPKKHAEEIIALAKEAAERYVVGDPAEETTTLGPIVNQRQFDHVQGLIQQGIDEGARLVTGGTGLPDGISTGYYTRPTVFADVDSSMSIAREEIFGPVLSILTYESEDEAIEIANDSIYGLGASVQSSDPQRALAVARRIRSGHVYINQQNSDYVSVPFGGWKQSGTGYEHSVWGIEGFQLIKAVLGISG